MTNKIFKCAVYTRKSTEDGLEQEFNSLHAQREACEAFALSQKSQGWKVIKTHFNDGGYSGGNMKRPALKELIEEVKQGRVDIILVYKLDRLTRSLTDFSKLIELLDQKKVSFVSVTQQFNTTSSMGRLTLNMLLSFAQFEREVTGERIRDKIAASKKKGMWMGGLSPLGFDAIDKKLVINEGEAHIVKDIYKHYLSLGTGPMVKGYCEQQGYRTKSRPHLKRSIGEKSITMGGIYRMLSNRIYTGNIVHNEKIYPGLHDGIIEEGLFNAVQEKIKQQSLKRKPSNDASGNIFAGLIFDETGDRLATDYTIRKKGVSERKYRYYVSSKIRSASYNKKDGWRIPSKQIEAPAKLLICNYLKSPSGLLRELASLLSPEEIPALMETLTQKHIIKPQNWVQRITINKEVMTIELCRNIIISKLGLEKSLGLPAIIITGSFTRQKRGHEERLIFGDINNPRKEDALLHMLKSSQVWLKGLTTGQYKSIKDIAADQNKAAADISRYLPLAFLDPNIKQDILNGTQPATLTLEAIRQLGKVPADFESQHSLLGY